jgi:hypothetical protein
MTAEATMPRPSKALLWTGRVVSALPVLMLLMSASMKLSHNAQMIEQFTGKYGYPAASLTPIACVELACALLFLVPQTSVLGAILVTGYLGGAVATHVRAGEVFLVPLLLGVLAWVGVFLRDERVRALVPLRRAAVS